MCDLELFSTIKCNIMFMYAHDAYVYIKLLFFQQKIGLDLCSYRTACIIYNKYTSSNKAINLFTAKHILILDSK